MPAVELPAAGLRRTASPLLEEEGDIVAEATIAKFTDPLDLHSPVTRTGFATSNQPVDVLEVQTVERPEQWLGRDEANGGGYLAQEVRTPDKAPVLDRDAHPDVRGPIKTRCQFDQALVAFCQDLERMVGRRSHGRENVVYERIRYVFVKYVAHRVHEDHARAAPLQRLI